MPVLLVTLLLTPAFLEDAKPPAVGDAAKNFALPDLATGKPVELSDLRADGPVVLVVLRGDPGYQCPICSRQVGQLLGGAKDFAAAGANVVMVYPGPADDLDEKAKQFVRGKKFPKNYTMLLDPDYRFTNAWRLRWDAPRETAYPSTFVIDADGEIRWAKVSRGHGDRADTADVLAAVKAL